MEDIQRDAVEPFIVKWQGVAASELSTSQSFLLDLGRWTISPRGKPVAVIEVESILG